MIRRGKWLVAGAVLGIAGYRQAERLARGAAAVGGGPEQAARRPWLAAARPDLASSAVALAHGIRAAMTSYKQSQLARSGPTLEGQRTRAGAREVSGSDNQKDGR